MISVFTKWFILLLRKCSLIAYFFSLAMMLLTFQRSASFKNVTVQFLEGVTGDTISLPCFVTPAPGDRVALILWYRNQQSDTVFTYDARQGSGGLQQTGPLKGRATFHMGRSPHLSLSRLSLADAGTYECRVDFLEAPSRTTMLKVHVVDPPKSLVIEDITGKTILHKFSGNVGESLMLSCIVNGGYPRPEIRWSLSGRQIDESWEVIDDEISQNDVTIAVLERSNHQSKMACLANNSNVTEPLVQQITLFLNMPPTEVRIHDIPPELHSGRTYKAICSVGGSRPAPFIRWKITPLGGQSKVLNKMNRSLRNHSQAWVEFKVDFSLHRASLTCEAFSPALPEIFISNFTILNVVFAPRLSLTLGAPLKLSNIREGTDVYFKCSILANPGVTVIRWFKDTKEVRHNPDSGILASTTYLVLQKITRKASGEYSCRSSNSIGAASSNYLKITVLYAPVCVRPGAIMRVSLGQEISVPCLVIANPANITFSWTFTNSANQQLNMTEESISRSGFESNLSYKPKKSEDYGALRCYARNSIGKQRNPCRINIKAAGSPVAPVNCTVSNQTWESFEVTCGGNLDLFNKDMEGNHEPFQGSGPPQLPRVQEDTADRLNPVEIRDDENEEDFAELAIYSDQPKYLLTVRERVSRALVYNLTGANRVFSVSGLTPGLDYAITISRFNSHGRSTAVTLEALTLRTAENRMREQQPDNDTAILGAMVGALVLLIVIGVAIILFALRGRSLTRTVDDSAIIITSKTAANDETSNDYGLQKNSRETKGITEETLLLERNSTTASSSRSWGYNRSPDKNTPDLIETKHTESLTLNPNEINTYHSSQQHIGNEVESTDSEDFLNKNYTSSYLPSVRFKSSPQSCNSSPVTSSLPYTGGFSSPSSVGTQVLRNFSTNLSNSSSSIKQQHYIRAEGETYPDRESFL